MASARVFKIAATIAVSYAALAFGVGLLYRQGWITLAVAKLMLVALVGLFVGFGALIGIYRLVVRIDELSGSRRVRPQKKPPA